MKDIAIVEKSIRRREDGLAVTTSKHVADTFDRRHDNVLRDIKALDCSAKYRLLNFEETIIERPHPKGKGVLSSPIYEITKDGLMFLVMGYKGHKAARIKEMWIEAFNKMELAVRIQAENQAYLQEQMMQVRENNRKLTARLLATTPYWGRIKQYKELDLTNREVGRLIGKSTSFVGRTLKKMKGMGINPASKPMELVTTKILLDSQRRITDAYRKELPGRYDEMVIRSRNDLINSAGACLPV